jgi:7-cyano-7-deazaguanine synthase in queuosine biosynthesis
MAKTNDSNTITLLWTGGWDSTFRLLQLVLMQGRRVQPHYIIDPGRCSLSYELRAMQRIKSRLTEDHPELKDHIRPTRYIEKNVIPIHDKIVQAHARLRKVAPFGNQYIWISSYAEWAGLNALEIGAERTTGGIADYMSQRLSKTEENGMPFYTIDQQYENTDVHTIFKYFRYPIREISKLDMRDIALENGFYHLMELTWFCHHPRRNGTPCGFCTPCAQAFKSGMKFRLARSARFRYHIRWMYNREQLKVLFPSLYTFLNITKTIGRKMRIIR